MAAADGAAPAWRFVEVSSDAGAGDLHAARIAVADLDADGRPDLVADRTQVLLNRAAAGTAPGFRFERVESGLEHPGTDGVSIFVDLDGDAIPDAVVARSKGAVTWQRGRGDGSFEPARAIDAARPGTVAAIAAGDVDRDGRTDLFIGHWYRAYGERLDADPADLLLQRRDASGAVVFERAPLPEDDAEFDEERDAGGRPIYGVMIASLLAPAEDPARLGAGPQLLELAYGRRWNRLWVRGTEGWRDRAPALGLDGDADRSGRYPEWLRERAKTDPRFDRRDERPFRANGNTFDGAVGDLDGDGRFDLAVAEITHAWAGPSSDRSRVLLQRGDRFESPPEWSLDRIPGADAPEAQRWNQGDLFVELADLDLDGRLDLVLASGDYPDPPPFDERLRIFLQRAEPSGPGRGADPAPPRWRDATSELGVDHAGSGQIALADFDLDGRVDLVAGQSFTRFTPAMIEAAGGTPRVRVFLNRPAVASDATAPSAPSAATAPSAPAAHSLSLRLRGDPARGIAAVPIGAVVEIVPLDASGAPRPAILRQLMGPGGHSGKQSETIVHAGLGEAAQARVRIHWPCEPPLLSPWITLQAGRHEVTPGTAASP